MMYLFIFFFSALCLHICLYGIFIAMTTNCINIKSFCPKFTTPKFFLYFWMKLEYFFCRDTFYCLDYPCWTHHWYTLYQKMNVILIGSNLYKSYFKSFRNFKTNLLQTLINRFRKNYSTIFGRTNKMIKQYCYVMTLMDKFTHITKLIIYTEAELRGTNPIEIRNSLSHGTFRINVAGIHFKDYN